MKKRRKKRVDVIVRGRLNRRAKLRVRDIADDLWGWAVREGWAHKCAVCKQPGNQPHHLIPRQFYHYRYSLINGICLCYTHHDSDAEVSPHKNAAGWMLWLERNHPRIHTWYYTVEENGKHLEATETRDIEWYCDVIRRLRANVQPEDFERIVGQKFAAWLVA